MRLNDEPNTNNSRRTPVVIGLTGGIGSGKSTCAAAAISTGIAVFDCDEACVNAYKSDAFMERYRAALSSPNGCSDDEASALARKAPNYRQRVSPLLRDHVIGELDQFLDSRANEPVVVIDAPLLFE